MPQLTFASTFRSDVFSTLTRIYSHPNLDLHSIALVPRETQPNLFGTPNCDTQRCNIENSHGRDLSGGEHRHLPRESGNFAVVRKRAVRLEVSPSLSFPGFRWELAEEARGKDGSV